MLYALIALALGLTFTMFISKEIMLGWACVMFWAILGAYSYTLSEATWDIHYFLFFACMFGMVILCALGMNTLRTKKQEEEVGEEFSDEGKDDLHYIDEGKGEGDNSEESGESRQTKEVRGRAEKRRKQPRMSKRL